LLLLISSAAQWSSRGQEIRGSRSSTVYNRCTSGKGSAVCEILSDDFIADEQRKKAAHTAHIYGGERLALLVVDVTCAFTATKHERDPKLDQELVEHLSADYLGRFGR
jgi:hypothetical protein